MNKILLPITIGLCTSLTWAQSQSSRLQTFRGAIIDARCAPSDKSNGASAAITSPTGFSNAPGNSASTSQSGPSTDRIAASKASKRKEPANQASQNVKPDMGVSNDMCQPSQTTRMFAIRTVDGRILSFDDTGNTRVVGQFQALIDSSSAPVQSSPTGETSPGTQTANPGRATGGQVEVVGRLQGNVLQVESIRPVQ